jgi:predicted HicB family RNase H-like nuclease
MGHLKYKGYIGSVEFSEEDNCLFGKVLGMPKDVISYEGSNIDELKSDFEAGIDSYLDFCESRGVKPRKAYNGVLNIRIPPETHCKVALIVENKGTSINAFIKEAIEQKMKFAQ